MRLILQSIGIFIIAAVFGALAYIAYIDHYAFNQASLQLTRLQRAMVSAPLFSYGVIDSVDPASSTFNIHLANGNDFKLSVAPGTYIAHQDMLQENGIYTAITEPVSATLSDLQPGNAAAVIISKDNDGSGKTSALLILFGNPL